MIHSFLSIFDSIDKHVESLEWKTDTGHTVHGVLYRKNSRLVLAVNSKELTETVDFEYIYREDSMSNKRILYPYDVRTSKSIPRTELSDSWPVEISMVIDENPVKIAELSNQVSFTYESFLWAKVPESEAEKEKHAKLLDKVKEIETSIGKVSIDLDIYDNSSFHPSKTEKRMDTITLTIKSDGSLSTNQILMWNTRFSQLLTLLHKERVVTKAIHRDMDNVLVTNLVEDYTEASYAYREPIYLSDFVQVIQEILPTFVDNYDELAAFTEDLVQYYRDYPLDPPDKIQLLRLFTSIEQCANYAQRKEKILKKNLSKEEKERKTEFDVLLQKIKADETIADSIKTYLTDKPKHFYITSGNLSTPKYKIAALAKLLHDEYEVFSYLVDVSNVELALKMRNMIAHGHYDAKVQKEFYDRRDDLGQSTEQCLRMYILRTLGASKDVVVKHKDPLKAMRFNNL